MCLREEDLSRGAARTCVLCRERSDAMDIPVEYDLVVRGSMTRAATEN